MADTNIGLSVPSVVDSMDAYTRILPEISAIKTEEVVHITLDLTLVVTTSFASLPKIRAMRPQIEKSIVAFDLAAFDKLGDYLGALQYANVVYHRATRPPETLPAILAELTTLRDNLESDANALAKRGLLSAQVFKEVGSSNGHRALALDVQVMASEMKDKWAQINGKTAVSSNELDRAMKLADQAMQLLGYKDQTSAAVAEASSNREKAFTLFARVYDEARQAILYLRRHEGDGDEIAPSVYTARQAPRRTGGNGPAPTPDAPEATPSPVAHTAPDTIEPAPAAAPSIALPGGAPFKRTA